MSQIEIELIPENWSFAFGRQNTVRKGFKWSSLVPDDVLMFVCSDGRRQAAKVGRVSKTTFNRLTDTECAENHAYGGREELKEALLRAYGEFYDYDDVTLIEFDIIA